MSDAPAAPVPENGVPPVGQDSKTSTVAPGFKVFAGNLAYSTTDEGLKAFFAPVESDIISAQVIQRRSRHGTRSAGYGFVALTTIEAAQSAVEALNKTELDGRTVIVEIAKPAEEKSKESRPPKRFRRRFMGGRRGPKSAPEEVTDAEANGEITDKAETAPGTAPATEEAEKPKKKKKKTHRRNKPKPAEGEDSAPATDAPETDRAEDAPNSRPRYRRPRAPRPPRPAGEDPVGEPSKTVLFVANLGFNIDDEGLSALFADAGIKVVSARIVRRRWGKPRKSKGYGFVDVGDEAEQKKAIDALQGKEVGGRAIAVKVAVNAPHEDAKDADESKTPDAVVEEEA